MSTYFVGVNDVPGAEDVHAAFEHHSRMKSAEIQQQAGRMANAKERRRQGEGYYKKKDALELDTLKQSNEKLQLELEKTKFEKEIRDTIHKTNPELYANSATAKILDDLATREASIMGKNNEKAFLEMSSFKTKYETGTATDTDLQNMLDVLNARFEGDEDFTLEQIKALSQEQFQQLFNMNYATVSASYDSMLKMREETNKQYAAARAKAIYDPSAQKGDQKQLMVKNKDGSVTVVPNAQVIENEDGSVTTHLDGKSYEGYPPGADYFTGNLMTPDASFESGTGDTTDDVVKAAAQLSTVINYTDTILSQEQITPADMRTMFPEKVAGLSQVLRGVIPDTAAPIQALLQGVEDGSVDTSLPGVRTKVQLAMLAAMYSKAVAGDRGGATTATIKHLQETLNSTDLLQNERSMRVRLEVIRESMVHALREKHTEYMFRAGEDAVHSPEALQAFSALNTKTGKPSSAKVIEVGEWEELVRRANSGDKAAEADIDDLFNQGYRVNRGGKLLPILAR